MKRIPGRLSWSLTIICLFLLMDETTAQPKGYLYDEAKVADYNLPELLKFNDGSRVRTADDWKQRRKEIFDFFETQVYGKAPTQPVRVSVTHSQSKTIRSGQAVLEQTSLRITDFGPTVSVLIIRPKQSEPVPAFLALNFMGNHTVTADPDVAITQNWVRNDKRFGANNHKASATGRGKQSHRWAIDQILNAGYALVTVYYGDIDPDFNDGFKNGIHKAIRSGPTETPAADEWGSIAGWAYGLSRILDYLETHDQIQSKRVFALGHSRLGKTALWAGATDSRFAGVISNNSGCGGAALSKRKFGETLKRINTSFPHWFCDNFLQYNDNENRLPVDQHMLIALIAPTPVYVASASEDLWADPRGEFLATQHASPVFKLLTGKSLEIEEFPPNNRPSHGVLSYHCRRGKHDVTDFDWENYIKFADQITE
ncbi:MAG: acetylxylan esterase [Planctomycetota bacterium]|nr:acetylxylan esterase [Planctomycetota bacterium]